MWGLEGTQWYLTLMGAWEIEGRMGIWWRLEPAHEEGGRPPLVNEDGEGREENLWVDFATWKRVATV